MKPEAMKFVKWPKLHVWHIVRHPGGDTVCGLPMKMSVVVPAVKLERETGRGKRRVCGSCDRMKDGMRLA